VREKVKMTAEEYHGILINRSQRDRSIFAELDVIGRKKFFLGLIVFYKIRVRAQDINTVIKRVQENMSSRFLIKKQQYYAHFYRADELIIVFRDKVFRAATDKKTWKDAMAYGRSLRIADNQLDFVPNRFQDETF
jgi:hypothetical protein